ncbi:MAG: hypothetical protein IJ306_02660 [Oscillospiraceae bacterium]|nr:hypothetical protein [Oscillospiraceae bacterium]
MTETEYKRLLIDVALISDYDKKDEVVDLLRICNVTFEKTGAFAYSGIWDQRKEYIYLSIIPDRLLQLKTHSKFIKELCYEIYPVTNEYTLSDILFKPGALPALEEVSQEILFKDIQKQVIEEIQSAKYIIWIAMAWFTDPILYRALLKKKEEGISIEIVLDDNSQNRNSGLPFDDDFCTHWVKIESLYKNIMHDKFCIIDLHTVVHGTFNWTKAANYNKETISIDKNKATAESFADEFMKLKSH